MIIKNCAVCGKEFQARQRNYVHCSEACKKEGTARTSRRYVKRNEEIIRVRNRLNYRKRQEKKRAKGEGVRCKICGEIVEPILVADYLCQKHYHDDCVINEVLKYKDDIHSEEYHIASRRAGNQGYSVKDIKKGVY